MLAMIFLALNVALTGIPTDSDIMDIMRPYEFSAEITQTTSVFAAKTEQSAITGALDAGELVIILEDYSKEWYLVQGVLTAERGWVKAEHLFIPQAGSKRGDDVSPYVLERYADLLNLSSATNFLILTDINRQKTHVFNGAQNDWTLIKTFDCSTGSAESPTKRGVFTLTERGAAFYSDRLGSGAQFWIRFCGSYLFHSRAMDKNMRVLPNNNAIGQRVSNGCIRLYEDDAEWLFNNVPDGTTVLVN